MLKVWLFSVLRERPRGAVALRRWLRVSLLTLLGCSLFSGLAAAQLCAPQEGYDYNVEVAIETPQVRLIRDKTRRDLSDATFHGPNASVLGLMRSSFEVSALANYYTLEVEDGYCMWVEELKVTLRYHSLDIFVASEYPTHSCEYKVILEHEQEHVKIAKAVIKPFEPRIKSAMTSLRIPRAGNPLAVGDPEEGGARLDALLEELISPLRAEISAKMSREQAKIDTPRSYRATQKRCSNW